ncbi:tRNA-dihydrouridine(47) synthase [NAD(P)(+)]-like [Primulina tabacum]|uniref:tRNA-dihydrouridine(47) synthase [NAD(P)(+)]-like n=1 Tax=Primulina tabacum TaxID=48773 RepID=UPI003F5AD257
MSDVLNLIEACCCFESGFESDEKVLIETDESRCDRVCTGIGLKTRENQLREKKSALHLCSKVAKSGNVSSCRYNESCRFSHDLEAFKAQKPDDLEGICPFLVNEGPCLCGLGCRFAGTHRDDEACVGNGAINSLKKGNELNLLDKDFQKFMWKNKVKFPKPDASLKQFGLLGKGKEKKMVDDENDGVISLQMALEKLMKMVVV